MKRLRRMLAFVLAVLCVLTANIDMLSVSAQETAATNINVSIDANDGTMTVTYGTNSFPTNSIRESHAVGGTLRSGGLTISDPTYWTTRTFLGWMVCTRQTQNNGPDQYVQVPETSLLTTAQMLDYTLPSYDICFVAQWDGNDDDYYSQVYIRGYENSEFKVVNYNYVNNEKVVSGSWTTNSWGNYLREGSGIETQVSEHTGFDFSDQIMMRNGATHEGWLEFKVTQGTDPNGNQYDVHTLVSNTVYTTTQMLEKAVPDYDVAYVAKWSDIDVEDYFWSGSEVTISFEGNGGVFDIATGHGSQSTEDYGINGRVTRPVSKVINSLSDPVYWEPNRSFAGWELCTMQTVTDDMGNTRTQWMPVDGMPVMTTAEVLAYTVPDHEIRFRATWNGNDDDYYSQVYIRGYENIQFTFYDIWFDKVTQQNQKNPCSTSSWGNYLKEGSGIEVQMAGKTEFDFSTMTKNGAIHEGWLEFKVAEVVDENGYTNEKYTLVSDMVYTTAQMLAKPVPDYDVAYVAKWSDLDVSDYYYSGPLADVSFDGADGTFTVTTKQGTETDIMGTNWFCKVGYPIKDIYKNITDIKYWDTTRNFLGWKLYFMETMTDENGFQYGQFVPEEGSKLYTTEEALNYVVPDETITFAAMWDGNPSDYYSDVFFHSYGGVIKYYDIYENWDQQIKDECYTDMRNLSLKENGQTIEELTQHFFELSGAPFRQDNPNAVFEGWLEYKLNSYEDGWNTETLELISNTLYTTQQVLAKTVPDHDVAYVAKWSDIPLDTYFKEYFTFAVQSNGGNIHIELEDENGQIKPEEFSAMSTMVMEGKTYQDSIDDGRLLSVNAVKDCAEFAGWTVYTATIMEWASVPVGTQPTLNSSDDKAVFMGTYVNDNDVAETDEYLIMSDYEVASSPAAMNDILTMGGDTNYYLEANWTVKHTEAPEVRENVVQATTEKDGFYDSVVYCADCGIELSRTTVSLKMTTVPVTSTAFDGILRLEVNSALTEIPAAVQEKYDTITKVEDALKQSVIDLGVKVDAEDSNIVYLDVELKLQKPDGSWELVEDDNFPEDGVSILLPYPEGTSAEKHIFVVSHMITTGEHAGDIEDLIPVEEQEGLRVTVSSLSPIAIAYEEEPVIESVPDDEPDNETDTEADTEADATDSSLPTDTNANQTATAPATGDTSMVAMYFALIVIAAMVLGLVARSVMYRRK